MDEEVETKTPIDLRALAAVVCLVTFVVAATIGGFLVCAAAGFGALAVSCLIAALFLGADE